MDLPTAWNLDDKSTYLSVDSSGLRVNYEGLGESEEDSDLGIAFRNLKGTLYPCIGLRSQGGSIEVNFGSRKFKFAATTSNDMGDELLKNKYRAEAYYLMEKYKESFNDVNKLPKIDTSDEWASKLLAKIIEKE
ncbi:SPRY-domain-containing protein [Gigaspora margarita]|uniref:SPRY-domain-containing protein n=1 Tax=Gigaspora margarita TaxID=4874 RepID=A0A8H4EKE6_GIGMA|nr:SPRY-domain-containing protein [Gigaspora margarita]